jgi:hypothetical protein
MEKGLTFNIQKQFLFPRRPLLAIRHETAGGLPFIPVYTEIR